MGIRRFMILLLALWPTALVTAQETLNFVGIEASADADKQLRTYLQKTGLQFQTHTMAYNAAVRRLADWKGNERYLAHMTPYACVAAEMLGANFDILATYYSKATNDTTYHSFFVVNKQDILKNLGHDPDLSDLPKYLEKRKPATFIYHDRFSTSSYFLPSLYFRDQHVFAISESAGGSLTPIIVEKAPPGEGSSFLVQEVAAGRAQLAAVWDDTKEQAQAQYAKDVYFIQLPEEIPNDLLVLSKPRKDPSNDPLRDKILGAIRATTGRTDWRPTEKYPAIEKKVAEFQWWVDIKEAPGALDALGELRRLSARNPHYVTVAVKWSNQQKPQTDLLGAVEYGIRLSGTEFVLFDKDFHKRVDVTWTLESIHDGAIRLTSQIGEAGLVDPQRFSLSFMSPADLTTRIAAVVQSRMDRIRSVWPYQDNYPAVIRDLEFVPQPTVTVQRILWTDEERNEYEEGTAFKATINKVDDFYKLQLSEALFPHGPEGLQFEPMSNVAYRVILRRPSTEAPLFAILTAIFLASLASAAVAFAWDLRRKQPPPASFAQTYQKLAGEYHEPWCDREIRPADILWCDPHIDEFINTFKSKTALSKEVGDVKLPWVPISLGALTSVFQRLFGETLKLPPELITASEAGHTAALDRLIKFLVRGRRLSSFGGTPLEWDALEEIMRRNFRRSGIGQAAADARLSRDASLAGVVSGHFQEVIEKAKIACFFHHHWDLKKKNGSGYRLACQEDLGGKLRFVLKEGAVACEKLRLEFDIPPEPKFRETLEASGGEAWLLATIPEPVRTGQNGTSQFVVQLKPIALLKPIDTPEPVAGSKPMVMAKGAS